MGAEEASVWRRPGGRGRGQKVGGWGTTRRLLPRVGLVPGAAGRGFHAPTEEGKLLDSVERPAELAETPVSPAWAPGGRKGGRRPASCGRFVFPFFSVPPRPTSSISGVPVCKARAAAVTVCKPHARVSNFPTGFLKGWFPEGDFSLGSWGSPELQAGCAPGSAAGPGAAGWLCAQRLRQSCDKPRQWEVDLSFISYDD